ncbi:hypothetical protein ABTK88_19360, partial [Acinetobacter baumannii]
MSCSAQGSLRIHSLFMLMVKAYPSLLGWYPFQDPNPPELKDLIASMKQRIELEERFRQLCPTEYEKEESSL